jgi:hypothetical protein
MMVSFNISITCSNIIAINWNSSDSDIIEVKMGRHQATAIQVSVRWTPRVSWIAATRLRRLMFDESITATKSYGPVITCARVTPSIFPISLQAENALPASVLINTIAIN